MGNCCAPPPKSKDPFAKTAILPASPAAGGGFTAVGAEGPGERPRRKPRETLAQKEAEERRLRQEHEMATAQPSGAGAVGAEAVPSSPNYGGSVTAPPPMVDPTQPLVSRERRHRRRGKDEEKAADGDSDAHSSSTPTPPDSPREAEVAAVPEPSKTVVVCKPSLKPVKAAPPAAAAVSPEQSPSVRQAADKGTVARKDEDASPLGAKKRRQFFFMPE